MSEQLTDQAILSRMASGDRAAARLLFMRHHTRVYRFLVRKTGNQTMAEDITNETFLAVWRQAGKFEGRSQVMTWVLGIARYKALSALRKRTDEQLDENYANTLQDDTDTPDVIALKADKASGLRKLIDNLSPDHREVIDLAYYQGQSIDEIATVLDIPHGTVKTRMFHARKKLAEAMQRAGMDRGWP